MDDSVLTVEERLLVLEHLVDATIWGPLLDDRQHRAKIARFLYAHIEAAERGKNPPKAVLSRLTQIADALTEIDNMPDAVKRGLRSFL